MTIADLLTTPFQWGSSLRHRKVFHPVGVLVEGAFTRTAPQDHGLPLPTSEVIARVSKAVGMPGSLPDAVGLALRVPEGIAGPRPWDVLLVSAASNPIGRAVGLRPVLSWSDQPLTSLMPLRFEGSNWWLRARLSNAIDGPGFALDSVRDRITHGGLELRLDQARGAADFEPLGELRLDRLRTEGDVSFDPVRNTAPGVTLYPGWLAGLRTSAYAHSREGRDAD
ncbi:MULTISPECIES: phosphodiesterase [Mycobacterium]|uniref:phosphodiesterase n=1 Tax=Mycobacterium TaxID=1763 RepID=UPI001EF0AF1C|nr:MULTISPECIES: phosphodiesterase [Mycobacterium]BDB41361.1 hypothetical protein IWGMT90018_18070 [Mycobacterium kiyosense]BDE13116.1 hypothetical protein MKCMC460_19760 [Mycobacterium sp. 20KCMC460]GLB89585.1 hypothetical protein SRL2020130_24020 [Mycobacterium kiyosense]GLC02322.1 hypothetical protein SRL2020400_29130 [Mycobacterium kiyosense]GLC13019.1 hypothetical protein SRL2020448_16220 [Mycobacterium kiyosense]